MGKWVNHTQCLQLYGTKNEVLTRPFVNALHSWSLNVLDLCAKWIMNGHNALLGMGGGGEYKLLLVAMCLNCLLRTECTWLISKSVLFVKLASHVNWILKRDVCDMNYLYLHKPENQHNSTNVLAVFGSLAHKESFVWEYVLKSFLFW